MHPTTTLEGSTGTCGGAVTSIASATSGVMSTSFKGSTLGMSQAPSFKEYKCRYNVWNDQRYRTHITSTVHLLCILYMHVLQHVSAGQQRCTYGHVYRRWTPFMDYVYVNKCIVMHVNIDIASHAITHCQWPTDLRVQVTLTWPEKKLKLGLYVQPE